MVFTSYGISCSCFQCPEQKWQMLIDCHTLVGMTFYDGAAFIPIYWFEFTRNAAGELAIKIKHFMCQKALLHDRSSLFFNSFFFFAYLRFLFSQNCCLATNRNKNSLLCVLLNHYPHFKLVYQIENYSKSWNVLHHQIHPKRNRNEIPNTNTNIITNLIDWFYSENATQFSVLNWKCFIWCWKVDVFFSSLFFRLP